jgi:ceramide glucosyltransferase
MHVWGLIVAVLGAALAAVCAIDHLRLSSVLGRPMRPPRPHRVYPTVTVIRPIRGLDAGCRENTLALLEQEYPGGCENLFVFDTPSDPGVPVVEQILRERGHGRIVIAGSPPPQRTGKLNAMIVGMQQARGELIAFNDSDTRPAPDLLRTLVDALLEDPKAGDTFAPVVTHRPPNNAGETAYALLVNAWYGPAAAKAAGPDGAMPFIMGELMVFRRDALTAIGGLESAEGQLVDDMYLGTRVVEAGWKNVQVRRPLPIVTEELDFREFLKLFHRWLACSHSGLPGGFVVSSYIRGIVACLSVLGVLGAVVTGQFGAALSPLGAAVLFTWSQLTLNERFSGQKVPLRFAWMPLALPFIGAGVSVAVLINPTVDWRGRSYSLDSTAKLGGVVR